MVATLFAWTRPLALDNGILEFFLGTAQLPGSSQQVTKGECDLFAMDVEGTRSGQNTEVFQTQCVWDVQKTSFHLA